MRGCSTAMQARDFGAVVETVPPVISRHSSDSKAWPLIPKTVLPACLSSPLPACLWIAGEW